MKNRIKLTDSLIGAIFTLFFLSVAVISVVNFRPLYYFDIKALNIVADSGYSVDIIKENYNALIDYCSPFFQGGLTFPSFPSSANGLQHFDEVKNIFVLFYYIAAVTFILLLAIILYKKKKHDTSYLFVSSLTTILLPIVVAAACMINFDTTFILFHKIFFRNDLWYFDPNLDPIIMILPQNFFLHCAIFIISCILIGSLCLFIAAKTVKKRSSKLVN